MHKWNLPYRKDDVESGGERPLYPTMLESPGLRWGFIRKVYSIIAFQLLLTIAVAATVVTVRPIAVFFSTTSAGLALWIVLIITPLLGKALLTRVLFVCSFEFVSEAVFVYCSVVSFVLLPPETSRELLASWCFHGGSRFRRRAIMCIHKW